MMIEERDPDSLPDSEDLSGPCPRCGRAANFTCLGNMNVGWTDSKGIHGPTVVERVTALMCQGCEQGTVVIEEKWLGPRTAREAQGIKDAHGVGHAPTWRGFHWWPTPGVTDLDEAIPGATRSTYAEAIRCLSVKAYRAGVVMLRRTLETVVHDKGSKEARKALERNLAKALQVMAEGGSLDPTLAEWASEIKAVGNVGAHFDPTDDVSKEEAEDLQHLTRSLLEYLYEMPARIRRSRKS